MIHMRAPAKVNMHLHVTGRREDGYHLLDSLFVFTEFGDELRFEGSDEISLRVRGELASGLEETGQDNIIVKAVQSLRDYCERNGLARRFEGANILLQKNIPIAAGLGGGSADGAATLRGIQQLWDVIIPAHDLADIALTLGADLPPCLASEPTLVRGIGEKLSPLHHVPSLPILLVNPRMPLSTPQVFKAMRREVSSFSKPVDWPDTSLDQSEIIEILAHLKNDLERPAIRLQPVIQEVLDRIEEQAGCRLARMSGSGASCFGLFDTHDAAKRAKDEIKQQEEKWWIKASQTCPSSHQ